MVVPVGTKRERPAAVIDCVTGVCHSVKRQTTLVQSVSGTGTVAHKHLLIVCAHGSSCSSISPLDARASGSRAECSTCIVELAEPAHSKGWVLSQLSQYGNASRECSQRNLSLFSTTISSTVGQIRHPRERHFQASERGGRRCALVVAPLGRGLCGGRLAWAT
jgi:hypothetical protein